MRVSFGSGTPTSPTIYTGPLTHARFGSSAPPSSLKMGEGVDRFESRNAKAKASTDENPLKQGLLSRFRGIIQGAKI